MKFFYAQTNFKFFLINFSHDIVATLLLNLLFFFYASKFLNLSSHPRINILVDMKMKEQSNENQMFVICNVNAGFVLFQGKLQ